MGHLDVVIASVSLYVIMYPRWMSRPLDISFV